MLNNEPRTVEESYACAVTTSDMRVQADVRSDADVVIAAGMSPSRLGGYLLRLHSEYDGAAKPQPPTPAQIEGLAATMPIKVKTTKKDSLGDPIYRTVPDVAGAMQIAAKWHVDQCMELMGRLKSLSAVREEMINLARKEGMESPDSFAPRVIGWWLDQRCRTCGGVQEEVVEGTGRLSGRMCVVCDGSGVSRVPGGPAGRRLANYMDEAVQRARSSIKQRLRPEWT